MTQKVATLKEKEVIDFFSLLFIRFDRNMVGNVQGKGNLVKEQRTMRETYVYVN